jgi:hypothetical protein
MIVSLLGTLISFAVCLFLGILGSIAAARLRRISPNLTLAYRYVALPSALIAGAIVLVSSIMLEIRHYRQAKTLERIERIS